MDVAEVDVVPRAPLAICGQDDVLRDFMVSERDIGVWIHGMGVVRDL